MKIIFFGTPDFAVPYLKLLLEDKAYQIITIVTQPDKPVGRKQILTSPPVKVFALKNNLKVLQPKKIDTEFIQTIKDLKPDFNIVIAYGEIMPEELLNSAKTDSINVHGSLLPNYRGASPIQSAILNGDKETGITIMSMNKKMDAGGIYLVKKIPIEDSDTSETLSRKLADTGAVILSLALKDIKDGLLTPIDQVETNATYCSKITKEDAQIYPEKNTARQIFNKFRAFINWPGIFMIYKGKRLKLNDIELYFEDYKIISGKIENKDGVLLLGTKKGLIKLNKVQAEGKQEISAKEFINGFL